MADDEETTMNINIFPNEILLLLFQFFAVKTLVRARQVCKRWKYLIDDMLSSDTVWESYCAKDFPKNCTLAKLYSPYCKTWYDLYKSLSLWEHLDGAKDSIDEFCYSTTAADEIRSIKMLEDGLLLVHRRSNVNYCDITTQEFSDLRPFIEGDFARVYEHGNILLLHGNRLDLAISRWRPCTREKAYDSQELVAMFHNIKIFIVHDKNMYFANIDNQIFSFGIYHDAPLTNYKNTLDSGIVALSFYNNLFHVITMGRSVWAYINNKFELQCTLDDVPNAVHALWKYNFLDVIDWRVFYIWMTQIGVTVPEGPLRVICAIKIYGDVFLVGSQCGLLRIYYKPFINGELNLFDSKPIKQFNFSERIDIPILSIHPILKMEVVEDKHGHKILVAMPRKILLVHLSHNNECCISKAVLPYEKWEPLLEPVD